MKKRVILLFSILPFMVGFFMAYFQGKPISQAISFSTSNILPTDIIILSSSGDIYKLNQNNTIQITHNQNLIEPVIAANNVVAVEKSTSYSSLVLYDMSGNKIKILFDGNSGNIDTMSWATDPAINPDQNQIAFVSDKDKSQTNVPDNALYVLNLSDGKSTNIAKPDPYSGGIAHPIFDPADGNIIIYDYYQYDPQTLTPYSTIEEYNKETGLVTTLTFENKNAYQEAFSPDGKQLLFLGRNGDTNTVTLYLADFTDNGLTNMQILATGDFAYPIFSNTKNNIYFLQAEGDSGYNLMTATIQKNKLLNPLHITGGFRLLGNSSFSVVKTIDNKYDK